MIVDIFSCIFLTIIFLTCCVLFVFSVIKDKKEEKKILSDISEISINISNICHLLDVIYDSTSGIEYKLNSKFDSKIETLKKDGDNNAI